MPKTTAQSLTQIKARKQRLEQDQSGKRTQPLIFKSKRGNAMDFAMNDGFAKVYTSGLRWSCWMITSLQYYQLQGRFFMGKSDLCALIYGFSGSHFW
jgi:hypothetical protein